MQTFCTDTILVLRSSWRGSYRTAWPKQTPSLRPPTSTAVLTKGKIRTGNSSKVLSITDKGNVSSDYPTLSSDRMGPDFSVLKSREMTSLTGAGLLGSPHPKPCLSSVQRRPMAVVTPFHFSYANPLHPGWPGARGPKCIGLWMCCKRKVSPRVWAPREWVRI